MIKECPKVAAAAAAKEAKKKEVGMAADASNSNVESANVVQELEWTFFVQVQLL